MRSKKTSVTSRVLLFLLILSVCVVGALLVLKEKYLVDTGSFFSRFLNFFEVLNTLSLSYITSYLFYVVVSIPEKRRQASIDKYVGIYLERVVNCLEEFSTVSQYFHRNEVHSLHESPKIESKQRETGQVEFLTYKDHFVKFYVLFNNEYKNLSYYIAYIDDALRECLYILATNDLLDRINDMLIKHDDASYNESFLKYYDDTSLLNDFEKIKELLR